MFTYNKSKGNFNGSSRLLLRFLLPKLWIDLQEGDQNKAGNGADHHPDKEVLVTDQLL